MKGQSGPKSIQPVVTVLRKSDVHTSDKHKHKQVHVTAKETSQEDQPQSEEGSAESSGDVTTATESKKSETVKAYGDYQQVFPQQDTTVNLDPTSKQHVIFSPVGRGGGYSFIFCLWVCRPNLQTLTPFQTRKSNFL